MSSRSSNNTADPFNLDRFVRIQDARGNYATALSEMRRGRKQSHWIWYVFPQIAGLTRYPSETARRYAIGSPAEARAYLAHPVLGPRLREITRVVLHSPVRDVAELMGAMEVDQQKLRSSMTLFMRVSERSGEVWEGEEPEEPEEDGIFEQVLEKYFNMEEDEATTRKVRAEVRAG